jgi:hypothetical protein
MKIALKFLMLPVLLILLVACGNTPSVSSSNSSSSTSSTEPLDIFTRLNDEGTFLWEEDTVLSITDTKVEHIYFGGDCAVWVFPSEADVNQANASGEFSFYKGEVWFGGDQASEKGIALLTDSKSSKCSVVVFSVLNWLVDDSNGSIDSEIGLASMEGKWGSDSWMDDGVGAFLLVKSTGGSNYVGTFYTQGQSGGVFKDSTIDIEDLGDGLAEVTWQSGNVTTATWGKRDASTGNDMDPNWNGDIWFDCIGELDFAESRADCNFYLSNN